MKPERCPFNVDTCEDCDLLNEEIERLKGDLAKIKALSYPGNAKKTSGKLLNSVYRVSTEALKGQEKCY